MTEEKRAQPDAHAAGGVVPAARPRLGSAVAAPVARQAPTPLKVPAGSAGSPRAPNVAPVPEPSPSSPTATEVTSVMSPVAIEAALAEISSWRRETERKLARLETELTQLRSNGVVHGGPPTLDLSAITAPGIPPPVPHAIKEPLPPWAVHPAVPPMAAIVAAPLVAPPHAPAPVAAAIAPSPPPAPVAAAPAPAPPAPAPAHVVSIQPRAPAFQQYDLDMRAGDPFDLPSGLDGSKRKRALVWFVVTLILGGMAALVISALASQR